MPTSAPSCPTRDTSLVHRLREATGVSLALCDQCGACSAACPRAAGMDLSPCRMVRLAQTGFTGFDLRVLASEAIWMCTGCEACSRRCPHEVDLPRAVAFFRLEAERLGLASPHEGVPAPVPIHFGGPWPKESRCTPVG